MNSEEILLYLDVLGMSKDKNINLIINKIDINSNIVDTKINIIITNKCNWGNEISLYNSNEKVRTGNLNENTSYIILNENQLKNEYVKNYLKDIKDTSSEKYTYTKTPSYSNNLGTNLLNEVFFMLTLLTILIILTEKTKAKTWKIFQLILILVVMIYSYFAMITNPEYPYINNITDIINLFSIDIKFQVYELKLPEIISLYSKLIILSIILSFSILKIKTKLITNKRKLIKILLSTIIIALVTIALNNNPIKMQTNLYYITPIPKTTSQIILPYRLIQEKITRYNPQYIKVYNNLYINEFKINHTDGKNGEIIELGEQLNILQDAGKLSNNVKIWSTEGNIIVKTNL